VAAIASALISLSPEFIVRFARNPDEASGATQANFFATFPFLK
jgi:hypothetical protein